MLVSLAGGILGGLLLGSVLTVGPGEPYQTIPDALAASRPGDTIEVRGGIHAGGLVVDRPVTLSGVNRPVIDGGGQGTVITLTAPGAQVRGFVIRGSGGDLNRGDAGVWVKSAGAIVEDNQLEDTLYGIALDDAPGSVVRGNTVRGKPLSPADRGDGIRLWYSSNTLVEANRVEQSRDCVVWYSAGVRIVGNTIEAGRYGLHFMYDDGGELIGNVMRGDSVGAYLMYSRGVVMRGNLLAANRGPSGFGVGLKDVDDLVFEENWVVDNRVGAYIDGSPRELDATGTFRRNVFALNDIGLTMQPAVERNTFVENVFQDNQQQMSVLGGGTPKGNRWTDHGRGNYWGDYAGFDADDDGIGDVPYRAEGLFDQLMDRQPTLRLFQFGLASSAIEFAARAFPTLRPTPRLVDSGPLLSAPLIPPPPGTSPADPRAAFGLGLGLLATAAGALGLSRAQPRTHASALPVPPWEEMVLQVEGLTKRFGRLTAVDRLSFEIAPGEVVALWGPNGAGKTSALKCVLGLLPCSGRVTLAGHDALRGGRVARRALGYVPQEVAFHDDLTVNETLRLYARLKRVGDGRIAELLARLGLVEHARKPVGALSGGLKQRLALAVALLGDPPLLLLDEPTSNLDAGGRELLARLIGDLRHGGTAVLLTSHRLEEVEALADRVLVLERGRLAFSCAPAQLAQRLGLRLAMSVVVERGDREQATEVLRQAGLAPRPDGRAITLDVLPSEKVLPLRLLERAGISIVDFSFEEGQNGRTGAHVS